MAQLDPRIILMGDRGELYDANGNFLAEVNTFQAQVNVSNTDYQPAGSNLTVALLASYTVTLTFTETVVKDARLLQQFLDDLRAGKQPEAGFQGVVRGRDGTASRLVFRYCVPDGAIDLVNVSPGEIISRAWNWRVNEPPALQELLGG
jgi:hypothetical protein